MRYQTVLLFGPPGSGKGTQGRILGSIPGFFHCACGEVFRRINPDSEIGRVFIEYSSRGELVPDDVTVKMWHAHIRAMQGTGAFKPDQDILVLDGIPRNVQQARMLGQEIDVMKVLHLVCKDEEKMVERLRRRAIKENRVDDAKESVIRHRWDIYKKETAPVLAYYPPAMIQEVDAMHSPAGVLRQILDIVIPIQNTHYRGS